MTETQDAPLDSDGIPIGDVPWEYFRLLPPRPTTRVALYRFFGADGALLYVGITWDLTRRFWAHEKSKPWWPEVVRNTIEWHTSREDALRAETIAIREERPVYNVRGVVS